MSNSRLIGLNKEFDKNKQLYDELFVSDSNYRLVSSSPKVFSAIHKDDFGDNFYISEEELDAYVDGFIQGVTENVEVLKKAIIDEEGNNIDVLESGLDDLDIKLSLYRSFKSLNDKWIISSNYNDGKETKYFYDTNRFKNSETRLLYEYFSFVNRCGVDIGKKAVIDFSYLSNLANTKNGQGPTQTLYESLTGVLNKNNFNFFPLPSFVTYSDKDLTPLIDMFKAMDGQINELSAEPNFVCMFIGGSSRTLDIPRSYCGIKGTNFEYTNDSFDVNEPTTYPEDFKQGGTITAFKVRYGQEAQNHFSSLELDQAEFKETQDSLMVIDALTKSSSGSDPTQIGKGNNIYDVNLTRSYTCTVESLGNMQIQPMMFFKLENVPMFRGTYLITDVTHSITPHNVKTTFKGVRQPIVTVPIVTEALSLLDLALVETQISTTNESSNSSESSSSYTQENIETFNSTETNSKGCEIIGRLKTDLGLTDVQAAGIVGNLIAESGLIADRIQGAGIKRGLLAESGGGGYSWAQWTSKDRKQGLKEYALAQGLNLDTSPATDEVAYGFLIKEITESYSGVLKQLKTKTTVRDATVLILTKYERPLNQGQSAQDERTAFAQNVLNSCNQVV